MYFEFLPDDLDFMARFATALNTSVVQNTLTIPYALGNGSVKYVNLHPDFNLVVHQYVLREELIIKRLAPEKPNDVIHILFNIHQDLNSVANEDDTTDFSTINEFAIRIISNNLESDIRFPANTAIHYVVISVRRQKLRVVLDVKNPNPVVQTILGENTSFLFYEKLSVPIHKVLRQLTTVEETTRLANLYQRIKIQELIYLFFDRLLQRQTVQHSPIHKADIDKLFWIRSELLINLATPPNLKQLAKQIGVSVTKLCTLFNQIFGDSIYNYYQSVRMEEAANLLRSGAYSVSETGYQLGFVNLSHFSRLFEKHHGIKPKKYSRSEHN